MSKVGAVLEIALTRCYFCGEGASILLATNQRGNKQVKEAEGKVIDMNPCSICKSLMEQGVILIAIDPEKSDPGWENDPMPNPYRTGGWWVIKDEGAKRVFPEDVANRLIKDRWTFLDDAVAEMIGLYDEYDEHEKDN